MINNRQPGRRNRGRNNGRQNGGNRGNGDNGNRIDSRARGNAPQLLEKYRNMARDAQLAGDRVNTEYYLQFADHYFRVIADNRARQEENQARFRRNDESLDFEDEQSGGDDGNLVTMANDDEEVREHRGRRNDGRRGYETRDRTKPIDDDGGEDADKRIGAEPAETVAGDGEQADKPRRVTRGRKARQPRDENADRSPEQDDFGLDLAALPPAISRAEKEEEAQPAEEPAPRRRGRKPRAAVDTDVETAEAAE